MTFNIVTLPQNEVTFARKKPDELESIYVEYQSTFPGIQQIMLNYL